MADDFRFGMCIYAWPARDYPIDSGCLPVQMYDVLQVLYVGTDGEEVGWLFARQLEKQQEGWIESCACRLFVSGEIIITMKAVHTKPGLGYLHIHQAGLELEVLHVGIADDEVGWLFARLCSEPEYNGWVSMLDVHAQTNPSLHPELKLIGRSASGWKYVLVDSDRRSFAGHLPRSGSGLSERDLYTFMRRINEELDSYWRSNLHTKGVSSRQTAWVVAGNCQCAFSYGGDAVKPSPWPRCMDELMEIIMPLCGLGGVENKAAWPNSCNLNRYSGNDSIGWHSDNSPLFQGLEQDACIISLSLGGARTFNLRSAELPEPAREDVNIRLEHGDLCTMEGRLQRYYVHRVQGSKSAKPRINLTWR